MSLEPPYLTDAEHVKEKSLTDPMALWHSRHEQYLTQTIHQRGLVGDARETFDAPQGDLANINAHLTLSWDPTALRYIA
ncbi:hypothetical protein EW146_g7795 [Bondarzewia mesenterica]|uniref:Uncharacterized protein n=1 Tax=Bondarzewia mesenterica TaxID=1095465 RepID=A0A4S4LJM6_9AGAM|nr:hypothetical protein EW146_g7795 [Bondarzewia mesenterica]